MDIEKALESFATKELFIQYIKDLPEDAIGIMMFKFDTPDHRINEYGEELELNQFKFYGKSTYAEALWMLHNFIDYIRE